MGKKDEEILSLVKKFGVAMFVSGLTLGFLIGFWIAYIILVIR